MMPKAFLVVAATLGAVGSLMLLNPGRHAADAQPRVEVLHPKGFGYRLTMSRPLSAPHMTEQRAIAAAERVFEPSMFTTHTVTARYGLYHPSGSTRTSAGVRAQNPFDAWALVVTGLDEVRPAVLVPQADGSFKVVQGPNIHTEVIIVDDTTGKYVEAIGY